MWLNDRPKPKGPSRRALGVLVGTALLAVAAVVCPTTTGASVAPNVGAPGASYEISVACTSEPKVYVYDLGVSPPMTMVTVAGSQVSPGTWVYHRTAGSVDQWISQSCGASVTTTRFNVDNPQLFPAPTFVHGMEADEYFIEHGTGRQVLGTDCPAGSTATVTFSAPGGYHATGTAMPGDYGIWNLAVPDPAPQGDIEVTASCGGITYAQITLHRRSPVGTESSTAPADHAPTTEQASSTGQPARPVGGQPHYTG